MCAAGLEKEEEGYKTQGDQSVSLVFFIFAEEDSFERVYHQQVAAVRGSILNESHRNLFRFYSCVCACRVDWISWAGGDEKERGKV